MIIKHHNKISYRGAAVIFFQIIFLPVFLNGKNNCLEVAIKMLFLAKISFFFFFFFCSFNYNKKQKRFTALRDNSLLGSKFRHSADDKNKQQSTSGTHQSSQNARALMWISSYICFWHACLINSAFNLSKKIMVFCCCCCFCLLFFLGGGLLLLFFFFLFFIKENKRKQKHGLTFHVTLSTGDLSYEMSSPVSEKSNKSSLKCRLSIVEFSKERIKPNLVFPAK